MSHRRLLLSAIVSWLLFGCSTASADIFGPISLVSAEPAVQQVEYAHDPAISGDGRYVTFDGSYGGVGGVWRRDVLSGAIEAVAGGDAQLPSISEDGRYISFTTTWALAPTDRNEAPDVYVRDMSRSASETGAYTLASAIGGAGGAPEEGLAYGTAGNPREFGSVASGRSALSGDGRRVVFVTTAASDLAGARPPAPPSTPPLEVAVRDLGAHTTQVVTVERGTGAPVNSGGGPGAVYAAGGVPPRFTAPTAYHPPTPIGASISADGSTVAWLAQDVGRQAQLLPAETLSAVYTEPLWRRIADGPSAPTRRITGGSDPESPECIARGEGEVSQNEASPSDPCQGPFATFKTPNTPGTWQGNGVGIPIPRLSGDGYTVAFLAQAQLVARGVDFGVETPPADAYVADMHPGLTRDRALTPLTEFASGALSDLATDAQIIDIGISPDGSKVAFTTKRTVFPLGIPTYVTAPAGAPQMTELFDVNLSDHTLTRVTHGYEGGPSEHPHAPQPAGIDPYENEPDGSLSPSYSNDGNGLAFSSTASNLVHGDGNTPPAGVSGHEAFDGADAFLISRLEFPASTSGSTISAGSAEAAPTPEWRLSATSTSQRDGSVILYVTVPGAGTLLATAVSSVFLTASGSTRFSDRRHRRRLHRIVAERTVADGASTSGGGGVITLTLRLAARDAGYALQRGGLYAALNLIFTAPAREALRATLAVTFLREHVTTRAAGHHHRHRARGRR